jgi:glycine C-acetyltransferase
MHNDPDSLRVVLRKSAAFKNKLVIVDGVYSMDGDIAMLPEIIAAAREFGAWVLVDESHAIGVIGEQGRGSASHWKLTDKPDIITCSMGKALGATGGFVAGSAELMSLLQLTSRTFIYSTSLPPGVAAGLVKAIDLLEGNDPALDKLWKNIRWFREYMKSEWPGVLESKTAIFPLVIRDEVKLLQLASSLRNQDVFVVPIFYPVVPRRKSRIRISVNAALSQDELKLASDRINGSKYYLGVS